MADIVIYHNVNSGISYGADGSELSANNPLDIKLGNLKAYAVQLLTTSPSIDANGIVSIDPSIKYTGYVGRSVSAAATIDNNFNKTDVNPLLATELTASTPVSSISFTNFDDTPRIIGKIIITNSGGDSQILYYNGFTDNGGGSYTFVTADSDYAVSDFTPSYNFSIGDSSIYYEQPIIQSIDNDDTGYATGLFEGSLDAGGFIYADEVADSSEIADCQFEHNIYEDSRPISTFRIDFSCFNRIAQSEDDGTQPSSSYAILDSRYVQRDLDGTYNEDTELSDTDKFFVKNESGDSKYITGATIKADVAASIAPENFVIAQGGNGTTVVDNGDGTFDITHSRNTSTPTTSLFDNNNVEQTGGYPITPVDADTSRLDLSAISATGAIPGNWTLIFGGGTATVYQHNRIDVAFIGMSETDSNSDSIMRLDDDSDHESLAIDGMFDVVENTTIRFRIKSADSGYSGNIAIVVYVDGNALSEQLVAVPAAGAWSDEVSVLVTGYTGFYRLSITRDHASANDTLKNGATVISAHLAPHCEVST